MSRISVRGEFANLGGDNGIYYKLGKKLIGTDPEQAKVEKVIIGIHNLAQGYIEHANPKTIPVSIALLNLLSNNMLPNKLKHDHEQLELALEGAEVNLKKIYDIQAEVLHAGINLLEADIRNNAGHYPTEDLMGSTMLLAGIRTITDARVFNPSKYTVGPAGLHLK